VVFIHHVSCRDIWVNALQEFNRDLKKGPAVQSSMRIRKVVSAGDSSPSTAEQWMGSQRLIRILRSGMTECSSLDEKLKIVYGFEQVLPPTSAYL
jgi:predicted aldo/keto reductase-like oxidoreductase